MGFQKPYIIGIAGGSASGKTTFIKNLQKKYGEKEICVISQDHYYRPLSEQIVDDNGEINFDVPEGIDFGRLIKDLKTLQKGKNVKIVEYTFNNPNVFPKQIIFKPAPIVVVEGLFIYWAAKLAQLFDLKVYIDANPEIMLKRRLNRDKTERGMTTAQIEYQWKEHVMPAYENYLLPHRDNVDIVVINNTHFKKSFEVLSHHFDRILNP
ncbi:MAG: AAA family ATPase [Flavobacteriales bacterium]|nr:AAA family ATPase [Flavobacteriales bacterium]